MVYKGNQRTKKFQLASFSQDQKRETIRNPKILATSQMDKMAPENVATSGTLKLDATTMAFTAKILSWRFRHLNIVDCLLKRRPTKGGGGGGVSRALQDPHPQLRPCKISFTRKLKIPDFFFNKRNLFLTFILNDKHRQKR